MRTIASKYKKLKQPVFAIFVDFKKAFDSVCRQALFLKLAKIGVTGNFYKVLRNMYSNSYAHIKLSNFLSNKFVVAKGTEQGHPLSPDLFKIFIADLSPLLEFPNCPSLSNKSVSHLLWADDLILISLDARTAQLQLNALGNFCLRWGIEINELKTQAVIFGEQFLSDDATPNFSLNGAPLKIVDCYCYLGIILHKSGSVSTAQKDLQTKAMRAFFGLKRSVMRSKLSFSALSTLFDSLIKPILLYGAPILTPISSINKFLIKNLQSGKTTSGNLLKTISRSVQEKVHLAFLKWALGVHRKTSNVGVWGETGRYPLVYQSIRLSLNYFKRISNLKPDSLVTAALKEQKVLKLPWYKSVKPILKIDEIYSLDHVSASKITKPNTSATHGASHNPVNVTNKHAQLPPDQHALLFNTQAAQPLKCKKFRTATIIESLRNHFRINWEHQKSKSSKLSFYHSVKNKFSRESYLDLVKGFSRRYSTTQLRISAHEFEIERGRYKNVARELRFCPWCKTSMRSETVEDEAHVLFSCDLYQKHRTKLLISLNKALETFELDQDHASHNFKSKLTSSNLESLLMPLLSPHNPKSEEDAVIRETSHRIHNIDHQLNQEMYTEDTSLHNPKHRQSYVINCISTFILRCCEERKKFAESLRAKTNNLTSIRINLIRHTNSAAPV